MTDAPEAPPSLDAIDRLLLETQADAMTVEWGSDRPLLPREASAILQRHAANPASVAVGRSRETVHAAEMQLRLQAASFGAVAAALIGTAEIPPGGLDHDALWRIGTLIGIDRALEVVLGPDQGREWLHRPNAGLAFGSRSPIDLMENDGLAGLLRVRGVLDGWKVGVFSPPLDDPGMPVMRLRWAPA